MQETENDSAVANPEMIWLARAARGLTQEDLSQRLGMSQARYSKLETGAVQAVGDVVGALAAALDFPRGFFFQTDRVYGPGASEFFHRKRASVAARALDKIHANINIRHIHLARFLRAAEIEQRFPQIDPEEFDGNVEEIARAVRASWHLPHGPVKSVVGAIEDNGGVVLRMRFDTNKVDAVSWWIRGRPPVFVVNEAIPADRERLTLCHELGHIVMHQVVHPEMEDQANRFAAAFLMPADDVRPHLRDATTLHALAGLKLHWRVSMQSLLVRATHLGTISQGSAKYLWAKLSSAGYRTREPAELDFPKEQAGQFERLLDLHTETLGYDIPQLVSLLNWNERELLANYKIKGHAASGRELLRVVK